jgi:hypothetical protein
MPTTFIRALRLMPGLVLGLALASSAFAQTAAQRTKMKDCLLIDDMTKERLDCFDAIVAPEPKATKAAAKSAKDCRFLKEEDERLTCFNKFAETKAKQPAKKKTPVAAPAQ